MFCHFSKPLRSLARGLFCFKSRESEMDLSLRQVLHSKTKSKRTHARKAESNMGGLLDPKKIVQSKRYPSSLTDKDHTGGCTVQYTRNSHQEQPLARD